MWNVLNIIKKAASALRIRRVSQRVCFNLIKDKKFMRV